MRSEASIELQEALDSKGSDQERYGQPHRIDRQQTHALQYRILRGSEAENHRQDGAYARRPSEGKGKANQKRAARRTSTLHAVQALVRVQRVDAKNSGQMQAKQNNN